MKKIHVISVGKNKDKNYLSLETEYLKRFKTYKLELHEVKSHEENLDLEADEVFKKLNTLSCQDFFLLTEKGEHYSSILFSGWITKMISHSQNIALIIGGASGHGKALYDSANGEISLSKLTFPHKMARLILVEQLYRAETISLGHPYNK